MVVLDPASRLDGHFSFRNALRTAAIIVGVGLLNILPNSACAADVLKGAGSSAAAPVYRIWAQEYKKFGGELIEYDPVGSGAGMTSIRKNEVDFGASDVIATKSDLVKDGLVMFPTVISGVVPVVNLPKSRTLLKLDGDLLARIFLGEISQWNDPDIAALNPDANLPSLPIKVVCRSDGSGTTYHLSDYLSKLSPLWKSRFGVANKHEWPSSFIAVKGSSEVSRAVRNTPGAIGYIDYNYVLDDGLVGVQLRNAAGKYVVASTESFSSAVVKSRWYSNGDFAETLTNIPGDLSWPIAMGTYVAIPRVSSDPVRAARILRFFTWAYANGNSLARQAKFVPLPEIVQAKAFREIASVVGKGGELIGFSALKVLVAGVL